MQIAAIQKHGPQPSLMCAGEILMERIANVHRPRGKHIHGFQCAVKYPGIRLGGTHAPGKGHVVKHGVDAKVDQKIAQARVKIGDDPQTVAAGAQSLQARASVGKKQPRIPFPKSLEHLLEILLKRRDGQLSSKDILNYLEPP